jgi:hypothetical protein
MDFPRHMDDTDRLHGAIFIEEEYRKDDGKQIQKMKSKTIPSRFRKDQ